LSCPPNIRNVLICRSSIIAKLEAELKSSERCGLCHFYCDANNSVKRDPIIIIGTFCRQLLEQAQLDTFVDYMERVEELRKRYNSSQTTDVPALLNDLYLIFEKIIHDFTDVKIIIDGLDECERGIRCDLLNKLQHLSPCVSVLVSSRPEDDISKACEDKLQVWNEEEVRHDIALYIHQRFQSENICAFSEEFQKKVEKKLVDENQGM